MFVTRLAGASAVGIVTVLAGAGAALAAPGTISPASCTGSTVKVYVPYVPYTYCYAGSSGKREVSLVQAASISSGDHAIWFLWKAPHGSWETNSLAAYSSFDLQGGTLDTISLS